MLVYQPLAKMALSGLDIICFYIIEGPDNLLNMQRLLEYFLFCCCFLI